MPSKKFESSKYVLTVIADEDGYVGKLDAEEVGKICVNLGTGRRLKTDKIDYTVGVTLCKKVGDEVKKDDVLAYVHANKEKQGKDAVERLQEAYNIVNHKVKRPQVVLDII